MSHKSKSQNNIEKIKQFCSYLINWEEQKDYYVNEFLPQIMNYNFAGLSTDARQLFLEIRNETSIGEWNNLIETIVYIQEHSTDSSKKISVQNPVNIKISEEKFTKKLPLLKQKYGFEGFVHTTSFDNFINIMKDKILYSRYELEQKNKQFNDIALQNVIEKTAFSVSKYVRFYWRTKTSTNYTNEGIKPKKALKGNYTAHSAIPVIMIFKPDIYSLVDNVWFTDKNAGKTGFDIFKDVDELDFNTIFSDEPKANYSDYEWNKIKPVRSAEILFPSAISTQYISKIIFRSECDKERVQYILGNDTRFIVDKDKFCNEWLYVDHYDYDRKEKRLLIHYHKGQKYKDWCRLSDYHHTMRKYDDKGNILDERDCTDWFEKEVKAMGIQLKKDESAAFLVYYIDGIECMRLKIND